MLAAVLTLTALVGFFLRETGDFRMFYDAGVAAREGHALYTAQAPNLNPPLVVRAVFGPLSRLPYRAAQLLWVLVSGLALAASLRDISRALAFSRTERWWMTLVLLASYPAWLAWFQGQIVWLLLYPMTRAWLAYRTGALVAAGLWLAPVIAVKPQAALLALLLPWRLWLVAGVASAGLTALGILWTGLDAWVAWWRIGGQIRWLAWPDNASLWGCAARSWSRGVLGVAVGDLPRAAIIAIVVIGAIAVARILLIRNPDRRLALAGVWMVLVTPLGWVYYLVLLIGPFAATVRAWRRWLPAWVLWAPLPLLLPIVMGSAVAAVILGSLYTLGVLALGGALSRE
jgi:hypothetical protein